MTVEDMLSRISSTEMTEWMALWRVRSDERRERELRRGR